MALPIPDGRVLDLRDDPGARPILLVHSSDDMYGADRMVLEVLGAMTAGERARVVVWLPSDYEHGATPLCRELESRGIRTEHVDLPIVRRRYLNSRGLARLAGRLRSTRLRIQALDPEWVYLATSAVLPVAPLIRRGAGVRVVLHMQEVWRDREARLLGVLALGVDRIVAISEASRASLPAGLKERCVVVPNGTADRGHLVEPAGRTGGMVFLTAGRWSPGKGHSVLLEAWELAGAPGRLVILGGPPEMGASVDVRHLVDGLSDSASVDVIGEVEDIIPVLDAADVMVVPSTIPEGFGLVSIEAFARARPVLASDAGGSVEVVQDGAGWLVPAGDVEALAVRLASLTRRESAVAGARARARFEARYSTSVFQSAIRSALEFDQLHSDSADLTERSVPVA